MKKKNKPLDFLPNIQNKYSIRKFTVGTASILVGSLLFLGLSNDASASTDDSTTTPVANQSATAPSDSTTQPDTTQPTEQPAPVESQPQDKVSESADTNTQPVVTLTDSSTNLTVANADSDTHPTANTITPNNQPTSQTAVKSVQDVAGSSLDATDDKIGPDPIIMTGVQKAADLPALTNNQVANATNQITWLDFSDSHALSNADNSVNGQLALKVGTTYQKEVMPGLVVTATVKSLQPFEATPIYARRANGDPNSGYDANATNVVRTDSPSEADDPAYVVVKPQDPNWSHLKKAGIDTGERLTNFGSNKNYGNVGATFDVKTTYNGKEIPSNIVMADGEEAKVTESLIYTTNGSGWQLFANVKKDGNPSSYVPLNADQGYFTEAIDKGGHGKGKYYATPDADFGGLGSQIFGPNQTRQDNNSVPIVVTTGATEVSFFVNSAGIQTVQMGFVILDKGDAPESYGEAIHAITENSNVSQPYLGTQKADVDFDDHVKLITPWKTDDNDTPQSVKNPDEGEEQLVGQNKKYGVYNAADQTYTMDVIANTGNNDTSYVRGWVDFNNNGVFDDNEGSELETVSRTGADGKNLTLTFKNIPQLTNTNLDYLGVRVRTSLAKDSITRPVGVAYSGEVEDFEIRVIHPPRGEKEETTNVQGQPQTAKVDFTAYGRVDKDWPKENEMDTTVAVKIVDDSGNLVSSLTVPGEGKYDVTPDGTVTFTPEASFTGTAKGIVLRATDLNGNTSGWTSNTEANQLENINKGVNGTNTMDGVYIPTVTPVTPTAQPAETTGAQGQKQTGTPTFEGGDPLVPIDDTVAPQLVDPATGQKTNTVTITGEGTYTANPDGTVDFQPIPTFTGTATPVTVERVDTNGTSVQTTYTPNVTPVTPTGDPTSTTGIQGQPQEGTPTFKGGDPLVPINDTVEPKLVDPKTGDEVTTVTIPGEGTYSVDPKGKVTFTPEPKFIGEGTGVEVKRVDKNGTPVTAKYSPTVTAVIPTAQPSETTNVQGQPQTGTPIFTEGDAKVPFDDTFGTKLVNPKTNDKVDSLTVPGEGVYTVNPDGTIELILMPKHI